MILTVEAVCPICGRVSEVDVYEEDLVAWVNGDKLIQDAFSYLSADEREMLISGICPFCWDSMFGCSADVEEDEEEIDPCGLYPNDHSIEEEMGWDDYGYNEDMGYDPYIGCYTDDC